MVQLDDSNHCIESVSENARTNSAQTVLIDVTSFGSRPGLVSLRNTRNTIPTRRQQQSLLTAVGDGYALEYTSRV